MTNLAQFFGEYNQVEIRWNEDPAFPVWVAADIGKALELTNVRKTLTDFDEDEKGAVTISDTIGRSQEMAGVTESGLYRLIFKSRKAGAKAFQRWVFHEVLPQIRKTGSYSVNQQPQLPEYEKAVKVADSIAHIQETLIDQPRLAQFLTDQALNTYPASAKSKLTGVSVRGVAEIAEEMGFPVSVKNRSQLGKFVKSQVGEMAQEEKRLCNGTMRVINCYPDCEEVRSAIALFFE